MESYTLRTGIRERPEPKYELNSEDYRELYQVCRSFFDSIAYEWPKYDPYAKNKCIGINLSMFINDISIDNQMLSHDLKLMEGRLSDPADCMLCSVFSVFDLIELICDKAYDFLNDGNVFFRNIVKLESRDVLTRFRHKINRVLHSRGLQYELSDQGMVERTINPDYTTTNLKEVGDMVPDSDTLKLVEDAVRLYRDPSQDSRQASIEKMWDAFERVKSMYGQGKKESVATIIATVSEKDPCIGDRINEELDLLTKFGNEFMIRHYEVDKKRINDCRIIDYYFQRCAAVVTMIIRFMN